MAAQRHHSGGWRNAARNPTDRKIGDGLTGSIQSAARRSLARTCSPDARSCRHTTFIDVWDFSVGAGRKRLDEGLEPAV